MNLADRRRFRFVQTDTGNAGAKFCGYPQAPDTIDDAVSFAAKSVSQSGIFCVAITSTGDLTFSLYYRSMRQRWKRQQVIFRAFMEVK